MTFDSWMNEINEICNVQMGLGVDDLPDYCWLDLYDSGLEPHDAWDSYLEDPDYGLLSY